MNTSLETLPFNKFNIKTLIGYPSLYIIGERTLIKDILIENILEKYKDIPEKIFISPDKEYDNSIRNKYNDVKFYSSYENNIIFSLLTKQNNWRLPYIDPTDNEDFDYDYDYNNKFHKFNNNRSALIILNCCLDDKNISEELCKELIFKSKEKRIILVVALQYPIISDPIMISNFDYIIINDMINVSTQKLYNIFASNIMNYNQFEYVLNDLITNYCAMIIKNKFVNYKYFDSAYKIAYYNKLCDKEKEIAHCMDSSTDYLFQDNISSAY